MAEAMQSSQSAASGLSRSALTHVGALNVPISDERVCRLGAMLDLRNQICHATGAHGSTFKLLRLDKQGRTI